MATTPIAPAVVTPAGIAPDAAEACDATNGNSVPNRAGVELVLTNTDAVDQTVDFITTATVAGYAVADVTVTIPAGATRHFGQFPAKAFGTTLEFLASSALVTAVAYQS